MSIVTKANPILRNIAIIKGLIWVYFLLLIFEGSLRMLLPPLSNALLVVRDPFLLLIYYYAQVSFLFPWTRFVTLFWLLGAVALVLGYSLLPNNPAILLYGFRCAFLHVPLIFIMGRVLSVEDVVKIGRVFLILAIPISILMAFQYVAGPDSWLNRGLDNQFTQIDAGLGKVRPPGTFTSVSGPASYFGFVVAFILYAQFHRGRYSNFLLFCATAATCLGLAVSISRGALVNVALIIFTTAVGVGLAKPAEATKFVRFAVFAAVAFFTVSQLPVFDDSVDRFSNRIQGANESEGATGGIVQRVFGGFTTVPAVIAMTPLEGNGIGTRTNAGMAIHRVGSNVDTENEWARVIFELGGPIGACYLLMRVVLSGLLLLVGFRSAKGGNMLPMILAGTAWWLILNGQWQQTTILGFSIFSAGLCLGSANSRSLSTGPPVAGPVRLAPNLS